MAIDGGSGSGKSSSARSLAAKLDCLHVDTGTHYRALTHLLQEKKIPYTDVERIEKELAGWELGTDVHSTHATIRVNRKKIEDAMLRSALVNAEVSQYSTVAPLRKFLLEYQRGHAQLALEKGFKGVVMEGRDIGLNIFPQTPYKYYLWADKKVKMARRAQQGITDVIEMRDKIDSTLGQLKKAPGAVEVDTTQRSLEETVEWIWKDITQKIAQAHA